MAQSRTPRGSTAARETATRLPSSRERRPALAALAVLLIVGGAFASGWLALQAGDREDYLAIADGVEIAQGETLSDGDLTTVALPVDLNGAIPADREDEVLGTTARATLFAGTILSTEMVTEDDVQPEGQTGLAIPMESTRLPSNLESGGTVVIIVDADEEDGGPASYVATVESIERPDTGDGISGVGSSESVVYVFVADDCREPVSAAVLDEAVTLGSASPGGSTRTTVDCTGGARGDTEDEG